ncbi:MAG: RDD family protein [Acidimicrobiales bacterium]
MTAAGPASSPADVPGAVPPTPDLRGTYAGFVSRLFAYVIDAVIVVSALTVGAYVIGAVLRTLDVVDTAQASTTRDLLTGALAVSLGFGAYLVVGWWLFGKSIGKAVMGLRVVRPDGTTPGLWRSILRYVGYGISALLCFAGFWWIAIDNRRRAWHDHLAGTYVIYDWDARSEGLTRLQRVLRPHG